jgi:hypothetical protein
MRTSPGLLTLVATALLAVPTFSQAQEQPRDPNRAADIARPSDQPRADIMGRVTTISPDGKILTLTPAPRPGPNGEPPARPQPVNVTLTDKTQTLFFGVGENQAQPTAGQMAMVWLEPGSKDQAARVRFMKREGEDRPDIQGRILSVSPDGKTITVESREEGQPATKTDLHLAPYTQSLYYNVPQNAAKPMPDYQVVAWLEKGSKTTPVRIRFMKNEGREAPPAAPHP